MPAAANESDVIGIENAAFETQEEGGATIIMAPWTKTKGDLGLQQDSESDSDSDDLEGDTNLVG